MKTINALHKLRDFSKSIEKINVSMKSTDSEELLCAVKEFLFSIRSLDTATALEVLADCLFDKYFEASNIETREMYEDWAEILFSTSEYLAFISEAVEDFNSLVDIAIIHHKNVWTQEKFKEIKQAAKTLIEGVRDDVDYLLCFKYVIYVFEEYVLPGMSKMELCLDIDLIALNKEAFYQC